MPKSAKKSSSKKATKPAIKTAKTKIPAKAAPKMMASKPSNMNTPPKNGAAIPAMKGKSPTAGIKMLDAKTVMAKATIKPMAGGKALEPQFAANDFVVYPTHGVGLVKGVETQEIAGHKLKLFVIEIEGAKMVVKVPITKALSVGLRRLSSKKEMTTALEKLKGRARVRRTMWSRRAQEYEQKINSGSPIAIAEVVRELFRSSTQPDQSYSERQIYQQAMDRLAREYAAVERIDEKTATERLETMLKAA
jgi:CarD family transcriptional regulator